jgi:O-antigen ligase
VTPTLPVRRVVLALLLAFIFTLPWENLVGIGSVGRVSKALGLLLGLSWAFTLLISERVRRPLPVHGAAALFVLWSGLSVIWTVDVDATVTRLVTCVQLFLLLLIIWDTIVDDRAVRAALAAYVLGAWVPATILLSDFLTGRGDTLHGRLTVGNFHPNDVGLILALGIPIAWQLGTSASDGLAGGVERVLFLGYVPVAAFAMLLTGSRTSLAAAAPWAVWVLIDGARRRPGLAAGILVCLGYVGAWAVGQVPPRSLDRITSTEKEVTQGDLTGRTEVWREAVRLVQARPLSGSGAGSFREAATDSDKVGHNFLLGILAEVGVIGLLLFLVLLVAAFVYGARARGGLAAMWLTLLMGWVIAASLHNWEYRKQSWFLFGLALVSGSCAALRSPDRSLATQESAATVLVTQARGGNAP